MNSTMNSVVDFVGKVVSIKPVVRASWLPEGHDGYFKLTGAETYFVPVTDYKTNQLKTGLTPELESMLEQKLKLSPGSLNKYNKDFWKNYKIRIPKDGKELYLENPTDLLAYCILKEDDKIANSYAEVADNPQAQYYMTSPNEEAKAAMSRNKLEIEATKKFSSLTVSDFRNILKMYALYESKINNRAPKDATEEWLQSEVYKRLKDNAALFLEIVNDKNFNIKVLIDDLVFAKILFRAGSKYGITGGDVIGFTLEETIDYLSDPRNQDLLISLKTKLENSN